MPYHADTWYRRRWYAKIFIDYGNSVYLHSCDIIHSDVGCHNWILTGEDYVKLIDFEGCSIDGGPAGSCYEASIQYEPNKIWTL